MSYLTDISFNSHFTWWSESLSVRKLTWVHEQPVYLSEWDDELTQVFFSAIKTDVVVGDEQLSDHVHLSERRPQRAVRVSV